MIVHAVEFDDTHDATSVHANASALPAALAMAERQGRVTGRRLIEAVAVGVDIACRLGLGVVGATPWTPAAIFGSFAAAAAVAKILGFGPQETLDALGICYSQSSGNRQCNVDRALVKRMQIGFAARAGVQSCQLVGVGITGPRNIFEGKVGMADLYFGGAFDPARARDGLGTRYVGAELSIKPYPSPRPTHGCIDAARDIIDSDHVRPDDISEVVIHVTPLVMRSGGAPFNVGAASQVEAQFSIAYNVAVAIYRGGPYLEDFTESRIQGDENVTRLAQRIRVVQDQEPVGPGLTPVIVEIMTRQGKVHTRRTDTILGNPAKPLTMAQVDEKFWRCAAFGERSVAKAQLDEVVAMVGALETVDDVAALPRMLSWSSNETM